MAKIGFDLQKYLRLQSERILERVHTFGGKLYLEFGGKLFDDYHASRVLPGFLPDSKMKVLLQLKDQAEIVIAINAAHIEMNKRRGDLGITYDLDVMRLIDTFRSIGLYVGSVVITQYAGQHAADLFQRKLEALGVKVYRHYPIADYPSNIGLIVSDDGYGKNEYIETSRPIVIVTAPGPGSGKMATCLSQLYQEHKRGVNAGYAKYETFPIWNLPLKHPVNLAYEAATADLADVNMITPSISKPTAKRRSTITAISKFIRSLRRSSAPSSASARTKARRTWASIWRASPSATTRSAARRRIRRSSAAILPPPAPSKRASPCPRSCASRRCS